MMRAGSFHEFFLFSFFKNFYFVYKVLPEEADI